MFLFYIFAAFVVWQGVRSLRGGFRFLAFVRDELRKPAVDFAPLATVFVPCRGVDQGLKENLAALFKQDYPAYEILFVTDSACDDSCAVIEAARRECGREIPARLIVAGRARDCGQKVHNLRAAVCEADARSEIFVFVDTDARPNANWLRSLIAPLADEKIGAATGYRWFFPTRISFASHLRAVWNASIASALGADAQKNFCWGGSMALRREVFNRARIVEEWRGALSDDFAVTRAMQRERLPIHFVPQALNASHEDCTCGELLEFTTRQMKITRVYAENLWRLALTGSLLFVSVFYGGAALVITRALFGLNYILPLAILCVIFLLGAGKAYLRLRAVRLILGSEFKKPLTNFITYAAHILLWHLAAAIYAYNAVAAAFSRRIVWRGIEYELKSPTETMIIGADVKSKIEQVGV
jgi:ceramide glucosyltransferase